MIYKCKINKLHLLANLRLNTICNIMLQFYIDNDITILLY